MVSCAGFLMIILSLALSFDDIIFSQPERRGLGLDAFLWRNCWCRFWVCLLSSQT